MYDNGASNIRVNMQRKQSIDFIGDLVTEEKEPVSKKEWIGSQIIKGTEAQKDYPDCFR